MRLSDSLCGLSNAIVFIRPFHINQNDRIRMSNTQDGEFHALVGIHTHISTHVSGIADRDMQASNCIVSTISASDAYHWENYYITQYCFLWMKALQARESVSAMHIFNHLVSLCSNSTEETIKLIAKVNVLYEQMHDLISENSSVECTNSYDKKAHLAMANIENLCHTISVSSMHPLLEIQNCFQGHLECISAYLVNIVQDSEIDDTVHNNMHRMLDGLNVLLHRWHAEYGVENMPLIFTLPNKRIIHICKESSVLFPTNGACPFTIVVKTMQVGDKSAVHSMEKASVDNSLDAIFGQTWASETAKIKAESQKSSSPQWHCDSVLVKGAEGILQEAFACQLIDTIANIWLDAGIPMKVVSYSIEPMSSQLACVEFLHDAKTVDYLKRKSRTLNGNALSLSEIFHADRFSSTTSFEKFRENFIASCAANSIITYILQISDRHNKNVLIRRDGSVIQIDFGFILEVTPGDIALEALVPFKLTSEYIAFMGEKGVDRFRELVLLGMTVLRQNIERVAVLIEMSDETFLPCLGGSSRAAAQSLRERALFNIPEPDFSEAVSLMIDTSIGNWITKSYDIFQRFQNGIEH